MYKRRMKELVPALSNIENKTTGFDRKETNKEKTAV